MRSIPKLAFNFASDQFIASPHDSRLTNFASYKDIKMICAVPSDKAGREVFEDFGTKWNTRYPKIYRSWSTRWEDLNECFNYPPEIRKAICTINAIESFNFQLQKATKNRSSFPNDNPIFKIIYATIRNASGELTMPLHEWEMAPNEIAVYFSDPIQFKQPFKQNIFTKSYRCAPVLSGIFLF